MLPKVSSLLSKRNERGGWCLTQSERSGRDLKGGSTETELARPDEEEKLIFSRGT